MFQGYYKKIEEEFSGTSYSFVEEYIVSKLENEFPSKSVYTKEEEELIRESLRKLCYTEGRY